MKYIIFAAFVIGAVDIALSSPLHENGGSTVNYELTTLDPDCPPPGNQSQSTYLPYYYDCSKFYECTDGKKVLQDCPTDLFWNIKLHVCDYYYNVDCSYVWSSTGPGPYTTSGPGPVIDCTGVPDETYFADPFDSTKFYECSKGSAIHFTCPAGQKWIDSKVKCA